MVYRISDYMETAEYIKKCFAELPKADTAVVLGSGLGSFSDSLTDVSRIPYVDIPHFPVSTVASHRGELLHGSLNGKPIYCMSGRFHYYEGYTMEQVVYAIRVLSLLGVTKLILTNAAGAIRDSFSAGDFMLLTDHIKLFDDSPARGEVLPLFEQRFFDMTHPYDIELQQAAREGAKAAGITLQEGVYAFMPGPQFETAAEIRMLRTLGADAVGMSTVPESIAALQCGMRVAGISFLSNMAAGISTVPLSDDDVVEMGKKSGAAFICLLTEIIKQTEGV